MTEFIYAGCATLILFIILLVLGKKAKTESDYVFIIWQFILLVNVITFIVIVRYNYPVSLAGRVIVEFSEASVFLHGPIFLFYTLSLSKSTFRINFKQSLHFLPFVISFCILISGMLYNKGVSNTTREAVTVIKMISLLVYTVIVILQLKRHRTTVEKIFSNTESKYLSWLQFLAWGIVIVWILSSAGLILYNMSVLEIPQYGGITGNLALCGLVFLIGYYGVRQEAIFTFVNRVEPHILPEDISLTVVQDITENEVVSEPLQPDQEVNQASRKYKNSGLSSQKSKALLETLAKMMKDEKPYHDSDLTLFSLAKKLSIHPNHLSQIINQYYHQNFFDYINAQRVNDVKTAMLSGNYENHSLLGIAYEFGFNSKASFNRAFKKFTNMTPSEFKKSVL
jgi:AraC-like DNA-binding protein